MTDKTELLPCPFCGGEPRLSKITGFSEAVYCTKCQSQAGKCSKPEAAIRAWNTRSTPYPVTKAEAVLSVLDDGLETICHVVFSTKLAKEDMRKAVRKECLTLEKEMRRLLEAAAQQQE